MNRIAGIVYPDVFQNTNSIKPMLLALGGKTDEGYVRSYHNLQMGQTYYPIVNNGKNDKLVVVDGQFYQKEKFVQESNSPLISDPSEMILEAYERFGNNLCEHLEGDFAFALLDESKDRLLLARDRIGKKPLYWAKRGDYFLFSSELKALLVTGVIPQTIAQEAVATYLALGFFPQDMTPIEGVNKLLPGYYLTYDIKLGQISIRPYWSLSHAFSKTTKESPVKIAHHLDEALSRSVEERLPPGGPVGCFISGGLGSGSIAYYVSEKRDEKGVYGYTSGFSGQNDADVEAANRIAKLLHIKEKQFSITPQNFLDNLVEIIWYLDEPIADPNIVATWELAKLAKGVGTVFSGMGSDELLAGHNRYTIQERVVSTTEKVVSFIKDTFYQAMIPILKYVRLGSALKLLHRLQVNPYLRQYIHQNHLFSREQLKALSPKLWSLFAPDVFLEKFHNLYRMRSTVSAFIYLDIKTKLPDQYIHMYERLTSAMGLEWKTPYLDKSIVEFAATIPEPETLEEFETASYLKRIFNEVFPKEVVNRPKRVRRNYLNAWVTDSGLNLLFPLLRKGALAESGLIDGNWIAEKTASIDLQRRHFNQLFALLVLEIWFRLYINRAPTKTPPKISVKDLLLE